jgi:hypothetical protein
MTNDPIAPNAKKETPNTGSDSVEVHQHEVPIVNVVEELETIEKIEAAKEEVLLEVDEADSLFEKRGGVKDGHGRY